MLCGKASSDLSVSQVGTRRPSRRPLRRGIAWPCALASSISPDVHTLRSTRRRLEPSLSCLPQTQGTFGSTEELELESLAGEEQGPTLPFPVLEDGGGRCVLDPLPLLAALGEERISGRSVPALAAAFHDAVASATVKVAGRIAEGRGIHRVALGGGVFQNARLLHRTVSGLSEAGLDVLSPRTLSPNDGAISYGQAAVAAALGQSKTN